MGTTCCCGKINCDQESVFFDVDRYINSEMKSFVEVTAKVYRSLFHWRPDKREPEELIKEETFSFQDEIGRFYNLKGEDTYAIDSRNFGRYQYRIEYTTKRKVALRFEIDDVYDWGKSNSFGHKFIDSIHFRTEAFIDDKSIPDQVFEFGEIIKSCSEDIADNIYYDDMNFNNIRPASFLPSSFEERSEDLETDGIQAHIYKLGENESMPDSVEEFDAKFGEGFNYETKVIDKVFRGAEVSESVEDPDTERAEPSRDVSAPANEGIAKIEYRNQDVNLRGDYEDQFEGSAYRALKQFPFSTYRGSQFGFFNGIPQPTKSYGKDVEIPYDKITSNGSYVLLIDCPNVGTGDFICNKALIELRRISGADLYNAPQFFKDTKTTFVPNDPNNPFGGGEYKTEKIEEQITGVICKPKVRSIAQEPTGRDKVIIFPGQSNTRKFALTAEYIPFDLETTPRFEDTACNEILLPNFILDPSNLEEWRSLYTRTEDGEYVSKDTFMDARFDFNSFLTGPNYFASGGKIELELFKPKTSNLKSGVAETYLQVLYELSYDRELELVGDYSSLPGQGGDFTTVGAIKKMQKQNRSFQQPTGRATAGDFGDTVNLEVVDPARVPLRLKEKNDNGFITFPREFNAGIYDTIQISNSKTKLLTTPKNFSFGSKRSHWTHTFSPDESKHYLGKNRQAKYIYRLKYRVIEGSSTFMGEDYILREFLAASPNGITDRSLASLRNNILSFGQFRNGSHLCFADHSCWITDITDDNCIRTNYPVFRIFDREDELFGPEGNVQFYPKKFISPAAALPQTPGGISVAADIKYKPPILPIDRFGAISPGVSPSRSNYLASLYIRGCAIESGTALVDVSSDLEMYSPNEVHAYNSVPHYGKFSAAKFRFKLRQQEFYPLKLAREDINDKCPKECLAMEHSFEWKLLESDWDVGDRSELSRADYGCTTVLHHQREVVEWGGSFTLERSHDVVLATYIPEPEIVYAACYAAAPRYPAVDDAYFDPFLEEGELPFDLAFICSYDKSGNLKSGPVGLATDYAGTGPTSHVTFVGPQSVTFPYDHDGSRQIVTVESKNLVDGYNGKFSMQTRKKTNNPNTPEEPSESTTTFFGMGSETNHVDAGAIIFENHNKVFDIIDTQAVEIENKYGENHQITLSEVSWAEAGDVFGENVQKNNTYPYSFHIENHKDFIVGTTINGIDLGYGRKTSQISNPIFTEITSGESEYVMRIQGEDEFYFGSDGSTSKDGRLGNQVTNFYNAGAGLRFRANASNLDLPSFLEEDDCSGEFENDMLFYRRYNDENVSPDRSTSLGNSRFDMSQAQWAIKNENYATLLYQQYIPIVQMLLNKTKLNHPYVEQIVSLIKDTDVDKYWYKIGVDVTVPLDPEEEGYSFTSVVAPKDATVSKIYNKDNFIGRLVNAGDNLFEIITGVEEVKWDFFAGSITEIKVKNGDVVEAGDVVMIGEVGGTTREVVSEVGGRITIDIAIGEELSKNQKLATVDIIEDVVSPVKGQTEQLYVSEGDEVEAGQVLAGVISTVTYEKDSYFYINQEGKNIGPFESAQGFTFKKSTGEYEVRDGVMLFLDGSLQSSTYLSDRIESASPGDPFFWYRETGDGYEIDGESFAESSFGYGQNWLPLVQTTDFGNPVLSSQTTSPVESFFSDAIIPRFTEFSSTINPMLGLGMDDPLGSNIVDISILENDGSYHTQPFTYITRLFEQDFESVVDNNPLFDNDTNEFLLIPAATQKTCDLCSTFDAFGNPVGLPECNSHHPHGYSGPPIPEFFNKIKIPEGETETFNILSTSTTNDSDRFSGEYFLDETARGSCGSLTTFFGLKTETDNSTPRLYYRKIIKKSKVNKCEKLPRLFFDYCNLISGWYLANNEASPVAHITTSLEYKPFRFGLNSRDVVRGNGIAGWTNRHDSLFLSDKDISDIGSMLDRIPKNNNTHNSFLNLVNASYLSWPAGLDENRPQLMGEPGNENVVAAYDEKIPDWRQTYASSFHADKHGGIFLKDYNQILGDVTRFFQERFQTSVLNYDSATGQLTQPLSNILYEHLNGINGNAGYTLRTVTNFVDAKSDGVCGIYKQGPQIPPGGAFVPERSVRSQNCLSVLQASLGMDIYTTSNNVFIGPMLPKIGPFDFTEQENDKELGYKTGSGDFFTQQFPETPGFMPSDDFLKIDKNKVPETGRREKFSDRVLGYEPRGFQGGILDPPPAGTVRSVELGFTKKVKTVPLSEYFFIIGDTTDRYEDI
jgi:hypothetical protein